MLVSSLPFSSPAALYTVGMAGRPADTAPAAVVPAPGGEIKAFFGKIFHKIHSLRQSEVEPFHMRCFQMHVVGRAGSPRGLVFSTYLLALRGLGKL